MALTGRIREPRSARQRYTPASSAAAAEPPEARTVNELWTALSTTHDSIPSLTLIRSRGERISRTEGGMSAETTGGRIGAVPRSLYYLRAVEDFKFV